MLDASFIEKITSLATPKINEIDGRPYSTGEFHPIKTEKAAILYTSTLTALLDLLEHQSLCVPGDVMAHVTCPTQVDLIHRQPDQWRRALCVATATCERNGVFPSGRYLTPEEFIIEAQVWFVDNENLRGLLSLASNLATEPVMQCQDDGFSQLVTIKKGAVNRGTTQIQPLVTLNPFSTFTEVQQPRRNYLLRLKGGGDRELPKLALYELRDCQWVTESISTIRAWLLTELDARNLAVPVIA